MITITDFRIEEYLLKHQPEDDPHLQEIEKRAAVCRMQQCGNAVPSISPPAVPAGGESQKAKLSFTLTPLISGISVRCAFRSLSLKS
jgi:hypothetical protein